MTTVTAGLVLVAALAGAIKAGPEVAPYLPAHRGYVVELIGEQQPIINQLLSNQMKQELRSLEREEAGWKIKLPTETDAQARRLIESRIKQIDEDSAKLSRQIERLKN